ncbi:ATP-binding protein [Kitasatospora mediocidica]|uniref:ATP-binding protein n=1 Tax=Kitasatospora mediocidica TaxID=58352 RepID=UPI0007C691F9
MVAREVPTSSTMAVPHGPASVGAARRRLRRDLGDREVPETVIDDAVLILSELLSNSCRYARPLARLLDLDGGAGEEFGDPRHPVANAANSAHAVNAAHPANSAVARPAHAPCVECAVGPVGGPDGRTAAARADGPREHTEDDDPGGVLVRWQMHTDGLLTLEVTDGGAATRPLPSSPSLTSKGGRGLSIVGELAADWGVRDAPGEVTVWAALPARIGHAVAHSADQGTEHARSA